MKNELTSRIPFPQKGSNLIKDPGSSIKLCDISTLNKNQSKVENKIKIEQSLSEIRLEEINSFNDQNNTYLSILKKRKKQKETNITIDEEVLPTNLSTKENAISLKEKIKIINLKINNSNLVCFNYEDFQIRTKTMKTVNNLAQSLFSETSFINGEEKLKNLVRKSMKNNNTSRSQKSSSNFYFDKVNFSKF